MTMPMITVIKTIITMSKYSRWRRHRWVGAHCFLLLSADFPLILLYLILFYWYPFILLITKAMISEKYLKLRCREQEQDRHITREEKPAEASSMQLPRVRGCFVKIK